LWLQKGTISYLWDILLLQKNRTSNFLSLKRYSVLTPFPLTLGMHCAFGEKEDAWTERANPLKSGDAKLRV
jgi:hypothetical protein